MADLLKSRMEPAPPLPTAESISLALGMYNEEGLS